MSVPAQAARRCRDAAGTPYGPFHDVQAMFDGDAAAAIGAVLVGVSVLLVRLLRRWQ